MRFKVFKALVCLKRSGPGVLIFAAAALVIIYIES
jgi:hypothetical protein